MPYNLSDTFLNLERVATYCMCFCFCPLHWIWFDLIFCYCYKWSLYIVPYTGWQASAGWDEVKHMWTAEVNALFSVSFTTLSSILTPLLRPCASPASSEGALALYPHHKPQQSTVDERRGEKHVRKWTRQTRFSVINTSYHCVQDPVTSPIHSTCSMACS